MLTALLAWSMLSNICGDIWCEGVANYTFAHKSNSVLVFVGKDQVCELRLKQQGSGSKSAWIMAMNECDDWYRDK